MIFFFKKKIVGAVLKCSKTHYLPVVTISTEDNNNFLKQLKSGFKRTIKWNKYRSEMTNHTKTIKHLTKSIDYLSFHLKMKKTEHIF